MSDKGSGSETTQNDTPPPVTQPTQPQGPKDAGSGKRCIDGGGDEQFRCWSLCCKRDANEAGD